MNTAIANTHTAWYLVHTKPRQENTALVNLIRQGYESYLPLLRVERVARGKAKVVIEAMFPRYVFVRLGSGEHSKSWSPIRSTVGVNQLVYFGATPARIDDTLIEYIRQREQSLPVVALFQAGEAVMVTQGPFAGIDAIYQTTDAQQRTFILLEILNKPVTLQVDAANLAKV